MRSKWIPAAALTGALIIMSSVLPQAASAIPAFARKEGISCDGCHTTVPRLNSYGFAYRKAGFRDPGDIGGDLGDFNHANVFSARIQARYDVKSHTDAAGDSKTSNQLTLHEVTLYPLSGSFGAHSGSLIELSAAHEDFVEIENAYYRYTWGNQAAFYSARLGIFHPFEGYGASDRPFSISRPFFEGGQANNGMGNTQYKMWGYDQAGAEIAYVKGNSSASLTVFNGLYYDPAEGKAFPGAGGHLQKPQGFANSNAKDIQFVFNQILKDDGSGLSLLYYNGQIDLPLTSGAFTPDNSLDNNLQRIGVFGSWAFSPQFEAQGGFAWGKDDYMMTSGEKSDFNSQGFFGEADYHPSATTTVGARYDAYDPSTDIDDNQKWGATVFANLPVNDGFQVITQYQHAQQVHAVGDDTKDDNFQVRLIWLQ